LAHMFQNFKALPKTQKRVITLCWMASGISSFFGLPLAGALFVLEVPHRMGMQYYEALSPVMVASLVGVMFTKGIQSQEPLSGPYRYPTVPTIRSKDMMLGIVLGIVTAALAFLFTFLSKTAKKTTAKLGFVVDKRPVLVMTIGGLLFGWLGVLYPQTLFWSEFEIPTLLTNGETPLYHTMVPSIFRQPVPYDSLTMGMIGLCKMFAILICAVLGFPGGILFPVYFVGLAFGIVIAHYLTFIPTTLAMLCMMCGFQVALLRTAWASNLILLVLSAPIIISEKIHYTDIFSLEKIYYNDIISLFSVMTACSYTALFLTRKYHYYPHSGQRSRNDFFPVDESLVNRNSHRLIAVNDETTEHEINDAQDIPDIQPLLS